MVLLEIEMAPMLLWALVFAVSVMLLLAGGLGYRIGWRAGYDAGALRATEKERDGLRHALVELQERHDHDDPRRMLTDTVK